MSQNPDAQNIIWREDNTRLSKSLRNDERGQKADGFERKLNNADQQLGAMENRYQDTENPLMPDDLQEMQDGLKDIQKDLGQKIFDIEPRPLTADAIPEDRPTPSTPSLPKGMIGMDAL